MVDPQTVQVQYQLSLLRQQLQSAKPLPGEIRTLLESARVPSGWALMDGTVPQLSRGAWPGVSPLLPPVDTPTISTLTLPGGYTGELYFRGNCWATSDGRIIRWTGTDLGIESVCPGVGVVVAYAPYSGTRGAAIVRVTENGTYRFYRRDTGGTWTVVTYPSMSGKQSPSNPTTFSSGSWASVISDAHMAFISSEAGAPFRELYRWEHTNHAVNPAPTLIRMLTNDGEAASALTGFPSATGRYASGTVFGVNDQGNGRRALWDITSGSTMRPLILNAYTSTGELVDPAITPYGLVTNTSGQLQAVIYDNIYAPMRYRSFDAFDFAEPVVTRDFLATPLPQDLEIMGWAGECNSWGAVLNNSGARLILGWDSAGGVCRPYLCAGTDLGYALTLAGLGTDRLHSGVFTIDTGTFAPIAVVGGSPSGEFIPTSLRKIVFTNNGLQYMSVPTSTPGAGKKDILCLGTVYPMTLGGIVEGS